MEERVKRNRDERPDLNSFTTKKSVSAGALSLGLFSSNQDQLMSILRLHEKSGWEWTKFGLLLASMVLQVISSCLLIMMGASGRIKDEQTKRKQDGYFRREKITL